MSKETITSYPFHPVADIFPMMRADEYAALKADIAEHGQIETIWLHDGQIIDGRNRYQACLELGIEPRTRQWGGQGSLVHFVISLNLHRRHLTSSQLAVVGLEVEKHLAAEAKTRQAHGATAPGRTLPQKIGEASRRQNEAAVQAAAIVGTNRQYISDAKRIEAEAPDILEGVRRGERTIPDAKKALQERQRAEQVASLRIVEPETCTVDDFDKLIARGQKFGTIYVDPPWSYSNQATRSSTDNHYDTMTLAEIAALPVGELAAENSHLHLWTTNAFIFECVKLFEAWGFEYKSMLIWCKPQMGIGNYWRVSHEILLLGVRGKAPFMDRGQMSWVQADRTKHSAKPEVIRQMIERVSPGPRIELFARRIATGWVSWGNEIARTMFDSEVEAA